MSVVHISKHSHGSDSQDHDRLSVEHISERSGKMCTRVGLDGPYCRKKELWARPPLLTPVPSKANHTSSHHRRLQTGPTPEKPARTFRLLGPCLGSGHQHLWERRSDNLETREGSHPSGSSKLDRNGALGPFGLGYQSRLAAARHVHQATQKTQQVRLQKNEPPDSEIVSACSACMSAVRCQL